MSSTLHCRGPPGAPIVALERSHNLLLPALWSPLWILRLQAWERGQPAESCYEHIVIKLKISEHSLACGVTAAMRAIIIGSENMRNCLQLALFYS